MIDPNRPTPFQPPGPAGIAIPDAEPGMAISPGPISPDDDSVPPLRITRGDVLKAAALPLLFVGAWMIADAAGVTDLTTAGETLRAWGRRPGVEGPLLYMFAYSVLPLVFVPRAALSLVGGIAFGWMSVLYSWGGTLVGESIAYAAARYLGGPLVNKLAGPRGRRVIEWIDAEGFWAVLTLRLLPFVPTDAINLGSGMAGIRYRDFLSATLIGVLPGCLLYSWLGQKTAGELLHLVLSLPLFAIPPAMGISLGLWRLRRIRRIKAAAAAVAAAPHGTVPGAFQVFDSSM